MKLKITTEIIRSDSLRDISSRFIETERVTIGRSPSADIRIEGSSVAFNHAILVWSDGNLWIEDQGSVAGTLVNGNSVSRKALTTSDSITIGDFRLRLEALEPLVSLHLTVDHSKSMDLKDLIERDLHRTEGQSSLRWIRPLCYLAFFTGLMSFVLWPETSENRNLWSPGALSQAHQKLSNDCTSCHSADFSAIKDEACLQCHSLTDHIPLEAIQSGKSQPQPACTHCHSEHRGVHAATLKSSGDCESCHQIPSFAEHPSFNPRSDDSQLKFNHEVHLSQQVLGQDSKRQLDCIDCHQTAADREQMKPVSFKEHCQSCHGLQFDEGFADLEVPHASAQYVFEFLLTTYRQKGIPLSAPIKSRSIPGKSDASSGQSPQSAEEAARQAETFLFEKGPCQLCHEIEPTKPSNALSPRYHVREISITPSKLILKYPIHSTHEAFACEKCHSQAPLSSRSSDDLNPKVSDCQTCHQSGASLGYVSSECSLCHGFHKSLKLEPEKQRRRKDAE